jgi:hypothetical protein
VIEPVELLEGGEPTGGREERAQCGLGGDHVVGRKVEHGGLQRGSSAKQST